jgi:hypothetical protein
MSLNYLLLAAPVAQALRYDPAYVDYNLNTNQQAVHPLDYSGKRNDHTYHPSPDSWRFPFYTVMLDKWVNGDPSNDNANGTVFEQDVWSTQLRHGGDVQGLVDSLDYVSRFWTHFCPPPFKRPTLPSLQPAPWHGKFITLWLCDIFWPGCDSYPKIYCTYPHGDAAADFGYCT